jgi:hypothetical protein
MSVTWSRVLAGTFAAQRNARNRGRTVTGVWFERSWGGAG